MGVGSNPTSDKVFYPKVESLLRYLLHTSMYEENYVSSSLFKQHFIIYIYSTVNTYMTALDIINKPKVIFQDENCLSICQVGRAV